MASQIAPPPLPTKHQKRLLRIKYLFKILAQDVPINVQIVFHFSAVTTGEYLLRDWSRLRNYFIASAAAYSIATLKLLGVRIPLCTVDLWKVTLAGLSHYTLTTTCPASAKFLPIEHTYCVALIKLMHYS